jgi:hypothetical protein
MLKGWRFPTDVVPVVSTAGISVDLLKTRLFLLVAVRFCPISALFVVIFIALRPILLFFNVRNIGKFDFLRVIRAILIVLVETRRKAAAI